MTITRPPRRAALVLAALLLAICGSLLARSARAQTTLRLVPVLQGLASPVLVTNARDGSNRLFVVELGGRIRVMAPGASATTLFLDIAGKVVAGGEQGLLGLAFHPQFASNGRFFVNYTRAGDGATVIAEYRVGADPAATAATEQVILTIAQPFSNHNGGMIAFGPDGLLYIATGDGGSANDPGNRAQNVNELLGKILRIDVDRPEGGLRYSSPPSNPYAGATPGRDEIYAVGLRNPFRFSFDRLTGELWAGDVGQGALEEIDVVTLGGNYGWRVFEGTACTNLGPASCVAANYVPPVAQYDHSGGRCSVTGGYRYRGGAGTFPAGTYIFGDYCTGEIFALQNGVAGRLLDTSLNISSFGEDEAGEIYVVGLGGTVQRLAGPPPPVANNIAAASAGAVASASSTYDERFPVAAINNGDRTGAGWIAGGGWNDATSDVFPDWVQVTFPSTKLVDRVVVYTLQDDYASPVEPTDAMTFSAYGITDFRVEGWSGSAWVELATVAGNNRIKRSVEFQGYATDRIRVVVTRALQGYARIVEVEAFGADATGAATNVAFAGSGATASASSTYDARFPVSAVNNGDRTGSGWIAGGGWNDATSGAFPDSVQVIFNGQKSIDRVVVYTLQDDYANPVEPSDATTFTAYGVTDFTIEGWNGTAWVTLASVNRNNLVKRTVTFPAFTTDRVRVNVTGALADYSRIVEIEAYGAASAAAFNVAAASQGATASASSTYSSAFPVAAVNDGDRVGATWGFGGGWNDATADAFPDSVEIAFGATRTIERVVVVTLQDDWTRAGEPGDSLTFSQYGVTDFSVQGWNGAAWVTLGSVAGNNLVKRSVTFAPFTTDRVRVVVTNAPFSYARIVEIEAWGR
ncbi:PQQ-dependent sugar dehydrogenase [Piscinibacter koreensis]|uniref:PQQ-dependent sugar dehydrogenase n=1 Tax=Piscinibacter koreensis TaxID=2742824 RepID=A0A7Y6TUQ0_9BURK|nr:PQQ-dependent sugar dehydrogenase [Schlegelella koreensis]NUZ04235.1 PQQ-dependent sugar dehydrogenase [Schlegelella koreensis]